MRAAARRGRSRRNVADVPTYTNRAGGNRTLTPLARPQILSLLRLPTPPRPHTAVVAQAWRPETVAGTGRIGYFPPPTVPQGVPEKAMEFDRDFGVNQVFVEDQYQRWRDNPQAVDEAWQRYFAQLAGLAAPQARTPVLQTSALSQPLPVPAPEGNGHG